MVMPGIDVLDMASQAPINNASPIHRGLGTSEASAQVAGAAALYRGARPSATAEETRAALLLNVLGGFTDAAGQVSSGASQTAYNNRNALGVGFVRDDLLAEFCVRDPQIDPLSAVVNLTSTAPVASVSHSVRAGSKLGVVACWRRHYTEGEEVPEEQDLPNVDLEVLHAGQVIARSAAQANSYERLVVVVPPDAGGWTQVSIRVRVASSITQDVGVQIVARRFADDPDPATSVSDLLQAMTGEYESASAGAACVNIAKEWGVDRVLPSGYSNAYGSGAFAITFEPPPRVTFLVCPQRLWSRIQCCIGKYGHLSHLGS